ncbi:radiation-inducible immediate-early gene IEX-1 [Nothobranchius furzeri]
MRSLDSQRPPQSPDLVQSRTFGMRWCRRFSSCQDGPEPPRNILLHKGQIEVLGDSEDRGNRAGGIPTFGLFPACMRIISAGDSQLDPEACQTCKLLHSGARKVYKNQNPEGFRQNPLTETRTQTSVRPQRNMYSRSTSTTLTVQQERFAFSGTTTRSTEPEVFTFERVPVQATAVRSYVPVRPKKRCSRVMYPAKVRMHLPPPERSQAKRWLVILCLVVLWQIYTEDPCVDAPLAAADGSVRECQGLSFQSAEEQARQLSELSTGPDAPRSCDDSGSSREMIPTSACLKSGPDSDTSHAFEQSAGQSMVALLVYHRLGKDN